MLSDIHGGADGKDRPVRRLGAVNSRCRLVIPVHVQDPMVADPVTGTEILVGVIIRHAPAEAAGDILLPRHGVKDIGMPEGVLQPVVLAVIHFRGEHVAVVLRHQVGLIHVGGHLLFLLAALILPTVNEIIECIDILQQAALLMAADSSRGPAAVQGPGRRIGAPVKCVIISRFVDPHTPQNDGRMISVLHDHILGVFYLLISIH